MLLEKLEKFTMPFSILVLTAIIVYGVKFMPPRKNEITAPSFSKEGSLILPWGNLGKELIRSGVIDAQKIESLYTARGGLTPEEKNMLYENPKTITVTEDNSGFVLNLLWAAGLGNKNEILERGEMMDAKFAGAGNFASTGGWSLASGNSMDHYSKHPFISLTQEQQALVDMVSKNIYRPCCGNSTHFPDCNHGMAMLGLLEILAYKGTGEKELYAAALYVNSLWFPGEYANISNYFTKEKISPDPKTMLGYNYSSGQGYQMVLSKVQPVPPQNNGGCGV